MKKNNETIIISVGGSLIVPENIDIVFLKDLKKMVEKHVENGKRICNNLWWWKDCKKLSKCSKRSFRYK